MGNSSTSQPESGAVLALYDFRGKQEFIYRTNRIKEITGASQLLANINKVFLERMALTIKSDWENAADNVYTDKLSSAGTVIYNGGGNLCVLYRTRDDYEEANRVFSRLVLEQSYSLSLVAACVSFTGDFKEDFRRVRTALKQAKNAGDDSRPCNALPFTKVDNVTFQPIVSREKIGSDAEERDLSQESCKKLAEYYKCESSGSDGKWVSWGKNLDDLAEDRGTDSLIAIIYLDGNSMTSRLDSITSVKEMRELSRSIQERLVEKPVNEIRNRLSAIEKERAEAERQQDGSTDRRRTGTDKIECRFVVGNGDENTVICNAHLVPEVLEAYFGSIEEGNSENPANPYYACAGIAICHAHDPYSMVYRIAEDCCKNAKKTNRHADGNGDYVDFHYCRSGITGTLEQIRERHEEKLVLRPYRIDGDGLWNHYLNAGKTLAESKLARSDIKDIGNEISEGDFNYEMELERLKAKDGKAIEQIRHVHGKPMSDDDFKKLLFDISAFYDIWFASYDNRSDEGNSGAEEGQR